MGGYIKKLGPWYRKIKISLQIRKKNKKEDGNKWNYIHSS